MGWRSVGLEEPYPFQTWALFNMTSLQPGAAYKLVMDVQIFIFYHSISHNYFVTHSFTLQKTCESFSLRFTAHLHDGSHPSAARQPTFRRERQKRRLPHPVMSALAERCTSAVSARTPVNLCSGNFLRAALSGLCTRINYLGEK